MCKKALQFLPCSFHVCVTWCQFLPCPCWCSSTNHCACNRKSFYCCTDWLLFTQTPPKHLRQDIWLWEVFSMLFSQSWPSSWVKPWTHETHSSQHANKKRHNKDLQVIRDICWVPQVGFSKTLFDAIVWCTGSVMCCVETQCIGQMSSGNRSHIHYLQQLAHSTKTNDIKGACNMKIQFYWELRRKPF